MFKKTLTLAAVLLATSTLSTVASAGGVRLQMHGPLGSFIAHPHLSSGPGGTMRKQHYAKRSYSKPSYVKPSYVGRNQPDDQQVHHANRSLKKFKTAPKVVVEREEQKPAKVKTAKVEDKTVASDAAPAIFVPTSPPAPEVKDTQPSTSAITTAAISPAPVETTIKATEPVGEPATPTETAEPTQTAEPTKTKPEPVAVTEPETVDAKPAEKEETGAVATRICRRFSAAVAGLITVPCGE